MPPRRRLNNGPTRNAPASAPKRLARFRRPLPPTSTRFPFRNWDQLTYGYADRYYMVISSAVDAIKRNNPDPAQRRLAHQIKLNGVLSMNDIVSGNDPYSETLDLVVAVTLESIVLIDENRAEQAFGDRAPGLIKAIRTMRVEAWELAAKVLNQDQLERLDYVILEWRRTHPEVNEVAFVKFDNFAGTRATGLLTELKAGGGFLAPLSEASQVMKDWGRLTERAFWYSKRAPNIAAIQAEGAVNEILSAPEISDMLQTADRMGKTAEAMPQTIATERHAIFTELDARQTLLTNSLGDLRYIMANADALGRTATLLTTNLQQTLLVLGDTLKVADMVGQHFGLDQPSSNPPGRPFDIQDYNATLTQLNVVLTNLQQLTVNAVQLAQSEGWKRTVQSLTESTDRRVDHATLRPLSGARPGFHSGRCLPLHLTQTGAANDIPQTGETMIRSAIICLVLLAWLQVHADTNQSTAMALLLDEKTVFTLTAGLEQYANPPKFAGKFSSIGSGGTTFLMNHWAAEFARLYPDVEMDIHGGGPTEGLSALLEGKVDLVPMSRPLPAGRHRTLQEKIRVRAVANCRGAGLDGRVCEQNQFAHGTHARPTGRDLFPRSQTWRRPAGVLVRSGGDRAAGGQNDQPVLPGACVWQPCLLPRLHHAGIRLSL